MKHARSAYWGNVRENGADQPTGRRGDSGGYGAGPGSGAVGRPAASKKNFGKYKKVEREETGDRPALPFL